MKMHEDALAEFRKSVAEFTAVGSLNRPSVSDDLAPIFVNIGAPPLTDEDIERLCAQDGV